MAERTECPECGSGRYKLVYRRDPMQFPIGPMRVGSRLVRFQARECLGCETQYPGPEAAKAFFETTRELVDQAWEAQWNSVLPLIRRARNNGRLDGFIWGMAGFLTLNGAMTRRWPLLIQPATVLLAWLIFDRWWGRGLRRKRAKERQAKAAKERDDAISQLFAGDQEATG